MRSAAVSIFTWGDVKLIPDGEAPDFPTHTRRDALPPEVTYTPRVTPSSWQKSTALQDIKRHINKSTCWADVWIRHLHAFPIRQDFCVPDHHGIGDVLLLSVSLLHLSFFLLCLFHL